MHHLNATKRKKKKDQKYMMSDSLKPQKVPNYHVQNTGLGFVEKTKKDKIWSFLFSIEFTSLLGTKVTL